MVRTCWPSEKWAASCCSRLAGPPAIKVVITSSGLNVLIITTDGKQALPLASSSPSIILCSLSRLVMP